jgi:hypothetical protein
MIYPLLVTLGSISWNFEISTHRHLLDIVSYVPYNDIFLRQSATFISHLVKICTQLTKKGNVFPRMFQCFVWQFVVANPFFVYFMFTSSLKHKFKTQSHYNHISHLLLFTICLGMGGQRKSHYGLHASALMYQ